MLSIASICFVITAQLLDRTLVMHAAIRRWPRTAAAGPVVRREQESVRSVDQLRRGPPAGSDASPTRSGLFSPGFGAGSHFDREASAGADGTAGATAVASFSPNASALAAIELAKRGGGAPSLLKACSRDRSNFSSEDVGFGGTSFMMVLLG